MKAREVLAASIRRLECEIAGSILYPWEVYAEEDPEGAALFVTMAGYYLAALLAAPEPTRLELARALVKAEGWRVVKVPDETSEHIDLDAFEIGLVRGWNRCRAATLASEGNDSE